MSASAASAVATRDIAYACRILVADALGGKKALTKVGKGLSRLERERAIVREVFGDVDVDELHACVLREWYFADMKTASKKGRPTGTDIANFFWTLFLRRVYRDEPGACLDDLVNVPRSLVVSGGPVGTRRRVRAEFFEERRVSPNTLRTVLERLVKSEKKTFVSEWFVEAGWHDALLGHSKKNKERRRESTSTTTSSTTSVSGVSGVSGVSSAIPYMCHPLDTPYDDAEFDVLDPDEPSNEGDLFSCGSGCGRVWDGNSQCQCFL